MNNNKDLNIELKTTNKTIEKYISIIFSFPVMMFLSLISFIKNNIKNIIYFVILISLLIISLLCYIIYDDYKSGPMDRTSPFTTYEYSYHYNKITKKEYYKSHSLEGKINGEYIIVALRKLNKYDSDNSQWVNASGIIKINEKNIKIIHKNAICSSYYKQYNHIKICKNRRDFIFESSITSMENNLLDGKLIKTKKTNLLFFKNGTGYYKWNSDLFKWGWEFTNNDDNYHFYNDIVNIGESSKISDFTLIYMKNNTLYYFKLKNTNF